MWIRELKETLRQTVFIMAFFILVPLLYLTDQAVFDSGVTFLEYMSNGLDLFLLITAFYLAYNMFKVEERDGATEYLLSLPIRRWRLLRYKVIPRVGVLSVLLLIGFIVNNLCVSSGSALRDIILNWCAGYFYVIGFVVFLQVCGFMYGLVNRASWITGLIFLGMILCVWQGATATDVIVSIIRNIFGSWRTAIQFHFAIRDYGFVLINYSVYFGLLSSILIPLVRIWDLKPTRFREVWFQRRAMVPLLIFVLLFVNKAIYHWCW